MIVRGETVYNAPAAADPACTAGGVPGLPPAVACRLCPVVARPGTRRARHSDPTGSAPGGVHGHEIGSSNPTPLPLRRRQSELPAMRRERRDRHRGVSGDHGGPCGYPEAPLCPARHGRNHPGPSGAGPMPALQLRGPEPGGASGGEPSRSAAGRDGRRARGSGAGRGAPGRRRGGDCPARGGSRPTKGGGAGPSTSSRGAPGRRTEARTPAWDSPRAASATRGRAGASGGRRGSHRSARRAGRRHPDAVRTAGTEPGGGAAGRGADGLGVSFGARKKAAHRVSRDFSRKAAKGSTRMMIGGVGDKANNAKGTLPSIALYRRPLLPRPDQLGSMRPTPSIM